ncbi:MAG: methyltransferase domain-containing protein [Burkholderiales bacterium]|nr:methyltransferase domain-containing protein [Burkholderiales bacterium]
MNRAAYDAIASEWDGARARLSAVERRLLELALEPADRGSRVLDLGCGTGRPIGEYVLARGFSLTGVDHSARMLALARERLPQGEWVESTLEEFTPAGRFGAAIAWDSLFHVPRAHHPGVFRRVRNVLPPGGRFALTVGGSAHPPFTDTMFGQEFFYDSHPPDRAVALLGETGFEVIHSEFLEPPTSGRDKGRFAIVARAA